MIVADERHRGGKIERFAEPLGGAEEEEVTEVLRERRRHADQAPHLQAAEDRGLASHAVDNHPGERRLKP